MDAGEPGWLPVKAAEGLEPGELRGARVEGARLCIGQTKDGRVFAMQDACPHAGGSLSMGMLDRDEVVCPLHAWGFHIETGVAPEDPRCPAKLYPARMSEDGVFEVQLAPPAAGEPRTQRDDRAGDPR